MTLLHQGFYRPEDADEDDSAIAIPLPDVSGVLGIDALDDSTARFRIPQNAVVVAIASPFERRQVSDALAALQVAVVSSEWMRDAVMVVADASRDVRTQLASFRKIARPDAAVLLVGVESPDQVREAHAAGAFACLRVPLVVEEFTSLVKTALDARSTRDRVAALTEKLDLETHLASIGRISAGLAHEISSPLLTATMNLEAFEASVKALVASVQKLVVASPMDLARARANVAHDLEDLEAEGLGEALPGARAAHDRLKAIVHDMRGLMQRDRDAKREPIDLAVALHEARRLASAELVGVEVSILEEPAVAFADRSLLVQILQNLLTNAAQAAKALSSPQVRLHSYMSADGAVISVRDNGPGIAPEMQQRIFEPFYTTRRSLGGTGLGLALCREYAMRMGAELSLWSAPGRGACFRVKMPSATTE